MDAKILVTGATGKVGRHLVHQLSRKGLALRAAVHDEANAALVAKPGVQPIAFDFDRPQTISAAAQGIETLVLLTPPDARQVDWAIRTIDLAKAAGVQRVVRMSVLAAAMEPGIRLGRWHRTVERYLAGSGLDWTIVRPGPFMQNFLGMYPSSDDGFALPVSDAPVNHIHVEDVAAALAAVVTGSEHSSATYMVTGGSPQSIAGSAAALGRRFASVSPEAASEAFVAGGRPQWFVEVLLELFAAFSTGAVGLRTSTFEDLTGRAPLSFDAFAAQIAASKAA